MTSGTPKAEVDIDEPLIRQLLASQFPDLASLPLQQVDAGWDNQMYRLGANHAVRMPIRASAIPYLNSEQKWLPIIAPRLTLPAPVPFYIGEPEFGFPWRWSLVPWFDGQTADSQPPNSDQIIPWIEFLRALHQPAPDDAPVNDARGVPLQERASSVNERLDRLRSKSDSVTPAIDHIWSEALEANQSSERLWLHGDTHARNILVKNGKITAVLDWGDMTAGDVASDLASIWMLFEEPQARREGVAAYGVSPALLARTKGWAVLFASILLDTGLVDHPRHAEMGRTTFRRLSEDG